ncbi:hypothetical protein [Tropicimonas sp. IMCC34011]|uniref:hypothetical protein n=1 Tax=Tropicimonas sp. IMCC34011 TaxID=2248759 RepID=UPI000E262FBF|nr:hypothetical protein [Tropicimonas sp. IMCC34011]
MTTVSGKIVLEAEARFLAIADRPFTSTWGHQPGEEIQDSSATLNTVTIAGVTLQPADLHPDLHAALLRMSGEVDYDEEAA